MSALLEKSKAAIDKLKAENSRQSQLIIQNELKSADLLAKKEEEILLLNREHAQLLSQKDQEILELRKKLEDQLLLAQPRFLFFKLFFKF